MDANLGTSDKKRNTTETAAPKILNPAPKRTSSRVRDGFSSVQIDPAKKVGQKDYPTWHYTHLDGGHNGCQRICRRR